MSIDILSSTPGVFSFETWQVWLVDVLCFLQMSSDQNTGWLFLGIILPSYLGIIIPHGIRIPVIYGQLINPCDPITSDHCNRMSCIVFVATAQMSPHPSIFLLRHGLVSRSKPPFLKLNRFVGSAKIQDNMCNIVS